MPLSDDAGDDAVGEDALEKAQSTLRLSAARSLCATWKISRRTAMIKITFLINITETLSSETKKIKGMSGKICKIYEKKIKEEPKTKNQN